MPHGNTIPVLRGIVFKEGKYWIARCLTVDHTAQAGNPRAAIRECIEGVLDDLKYAIEHDTLEYLKPAPMSQTVRLWADPKRRSYNPRKVELPIPSSTGGPSFVPGCAEFDRVISSALV